MFVNVLLYCYFFVLSIFILHSRESEFYPNILDGTSAFALELLFSRCLSHLSFVPLSALPKKTTNELAGLFPTISPKCRAPSWELWIPFFKVFWYDSIRRMNPRSTDYKANALALTTTPSRRVNIICSI